MVAQALLKKAYSLLEPDLKRYDLVLKLLMRGELPAWIIQSERNLFNRDN